MRKRVLSILAIFGGFCLLVGIVVILNILGPIAKVSAADPDPVLLDIVAVIDVSESMDFETNCFGCWNEDPLKSVDILNYPYPQNGDFNPLTYDPPSGGGPYDIWWDGNIPGTAGHPVCNSEPAPLLQDDYRYSVHEAEFYSRDEPLHGWEFNLRNPGQGFWVLQRPDKGSNGSYIRAHPYPTYSQDDINNAPRLQGASYNAECFDSSGGYSGECWKARADALGEVAPSTPPFVEYDFTVDWANAAANETHIWIRAIGGTSLSFQWYGWDAQQLVPWRTAVYWQLDNSPVEGGPYDNLNDQADWQVVNDNDWRWLKIGHNLNLANGQHTLKIFQGSSGFNLDKIIITNNPDGVPNTAVNNNGDVIGGGSLVITNVLSINNGQGPEATPGSATREACNICNPAFGQTFNSDQCSCRKSPDDTTVDSYFYQGGGTGFGCTAVLTTTNQLENDLFRDIEPLRSTKEGIKNLAYRLDPRFHQLGLVAFTDEITAPREKLHCLRYASRNLGGIDKCFDIVSNPISYTHIIQSVEDHKPQFGSDISEGIREGLEELGVNVPGFNENVEHECHTYSSNNTDGDKQACDRLGAAMRIIILLTDGSPDQSEACPDSFEWRGRNGAGQDTHDCALFYAQQAADNNVVVFSISIGSGAHREFLNTVATGTDPNPPPGESGFYFESKGGDYFPALRPDDISVILDEILSRAGVASPDVDPLYLPVIFKN